VGSQSITYTVNDTYGCLQIANATIIVNQAPTVAQSPFTNLCFNSPAIVLSGGTPAGGTYSGTSVSGGIFTPNAVGDFTITYTFTAANNCSGSASQVLRVENCAGLDYFGEHSVNVCPNPSKGSVAIELGENHSDLMAIRIVTLQGQQVYEENFANYTNANSTIHLDLNNFENGVYIVELIGKKYKGFVRVVLEK
jgi:hypothetical protein